METACIAILNKQKLIFFSYKIGEQEGRIGPVWGRGSHQWRGGCGKRV
jgi:hypothetical protein